MIDRQKVAEIRHDACQPITQSTPQTYMLQKT